MTAAAVPEGCSLRRTSPNRTKPQERQSADGADDPCRVRAASLSHPFPVIAVASADTVAVCALLDDLAESALGAGKRCPFREGAAAAGSLEAGCGALRRHRPGPASMEKPVGKATGTAAAAVGLLLRCVHLCCHEGGPGLREDPARSRRGPRRQGCHAVPGTEKGTCAEVHSCSVPALLQLPGLQSHLFRV